MSYLVSVIVPVYNPGRYIEPCIDSLERQTMPAESFEVLFVDDGSTDDTPARLDELARGRRNARVIHQPNSGWPGKPRNVGIEAARGRYVQFLDQDDALGPEALDRMYAIGARNDADIVLGKVTSNFRGVPHRVFRHTVESCTVHDAPLIESLTPHKMFRRAFLIEYGIRYPEGKRRLEDQLFMVQTYLAAKAVSIVGDYPCYFYRKRSDGKNAGSARIEPGGYYANLREVLDGVVAGTEAGEFRDTLLRRFYRGEMLGRLSEPGMLNYPEKYREQLFAEVRRLAAERLLANVPAGLAAVHRLRATLVHQDRCSDLLAFAQAAKGVKARASLRSVSWDEGRLRIGLHTELVHADAAPVLITSRDGGYYLDARLTDAAGAEPVEVTADLPAATADVVIRHRDSGVEWYVPAELTGTLTPYRRSWGRTPAWFSVAPRNSTPALWPAGHRCPAVPGTSR